MIFGWLNENLQGILTVIGGLLIQIVIGSSYGFGFVSPYLMSYLKQYNDNIAINDGLFLTPIAIMTICFSFSLGGIMEKKFGPHLPILIGGSMITLVFLAFHFSKVLIICYISMAVFGLGQGFAYFPPVKTGWYYYPNHKGRVLGIILCGFGFSSAILTFIVQGVINPNEIHASKGGFYPKEVYDHVPLYFIYMVIMFGSLTIASLLLIQKFKGEKIESINMDEEKVEEVLIDEEDSEPNNESVVNKVEVTEKVKVNEPRKVNVRKAAFSKVNLLLFILAFSNYCKILI